MRTMLTTLLVSLCLLFCMALPLQAQTPDEYPPESLGASAAGVDLWIAKYPGSQDAIPGATIWYDIPFGNRGVEAATPVTIRDTLPNPAGRPGLIFVWDNAAALGLTTSHRAGETQTLTWTGSLGPRETKTLQVVLRVAEDVPACTPLHNQVEISSPPTFTARAESFGPLIRLPELGIAKSVAGLTVPGEVLTYTIAYSNAGCVAAENVVITDTLPVQVAFISASPPPDNVRDGRAVWRDPVLDIGAVQTIQLLARVSDAARSGDQLTNTVTLSTSLIENSPLNNTAVVVSTVARADLALAKTGPSAVTAGQRLDYVLSYRNLGAAPAKGARLLDTLPSGVAYVSSLWQVGEATASPLASRIQGRQVEWALGEVAAGASGRLTVTVALDGRQRDGDILRNEALIYTATPEDNTFNNAAHCETTAQRADLVLRLSCPPPALPGDMLTYRLAYSNAGSTAATNVVLTDCLGAEFEFVEAPGLGAPTQVLTATNCYVWSVPDLQRGEARQAELRVRVKPNAAEGRTSLTVRNAITATTGTPDANYSDNEAFCATLIQRADISLAKRVAPQHTVTPGSTLTFTLTYTNAGTATAANVVLTDTLPAEIGYVAFTASSPTATLRIAPDGRNLAWTLGALGPGRVEWIALVGRVITRSETITWDAVLRVVTNTAAITTTTPESDPTNQTTAVVVEVAPGCPANLDLRADPPYLPADGASRATLAFLARDEYGNQVLDGTLVQLTTDHGCLEGEESKPCTQSTTRLTQAGAFTVTLVADARASTAHVEARVIGPGRGCSVEQMGRAEVLRVVEFRAADLRVSKAVWPASPVVPGEAVTFTLVYTNAGPGVAMTTTLAEELPEGFLVSLLAEATPPLTRTSPTAPISGTLIWAAGNLPPGSGGSLTLVGHFDPNRPGWRAAQPMENCVRIASQTDDTAPGNNRACVPLTLHTTDLWIEKQAMQLSAYPGTPLSYRIRVGNQGAATAREVAITDMLPAGTIFQSVSVAGAIPTADGVALMLGDLAPGEVLTLTLEALVATRAIAPGARLTNQAQVSTSTYDYDLDNNATQDARVTVVAPDLSVRLAPEPGPLCPGHGITYVLSYENRGNTLAEGVEITVTLGQGLCSAAGEAVLRYALGSVEVGQRGSITIPCILPPNVISPASPAPQRGVFTSTATIACDPRAPDPLPDDNTARDVLRGVCEFLFPILNTALGVAF